MKTRNIILYFIALFTLCSCDDMFTPADENTRQEDAMRVESAYANGLLMYGYSRLPYMNSTQTDIATDDAVTNDLNSGYLKMATGTWASNNDPMSQWKNCRDGIQYVNKFLSIVETVEFTPSSKSRNRMIIDRLKGESYAIRAILNYYLLMAHGGYADDGVLYGVPILTKPEDASSDFNKERDLFSKCVEQIYLDCDSAMILLPVDYKNISDTLDIPKKYRDLEAEISGYNSVFGQNLKNRISGRIAEAVKAQVALLAASPAFRDQSGVTSEEAALLCAKVLKNHGIKKVGDELEGIDNTGHIDWYSYQYKTLIESEVPEMLWRSDRQDNNSQEKELFPPSRYGSGRVNPSQNLVDAFPMNNGLPITDPNSGYDPQDPYKNRDMRLSNTVIYHGAPFKKMPDVDVVYTGVGFTYGKENAKDDNINDGNRSTRTGYYLKKLLREDVSANPSSQLNQKHIYPRIRYTEILLAYAEAANDAWGPNDDPKGVGFTAYDVIKAIRKRAGIGSDEYGRPLDGGDQYLAKVKSDKEKMTELIRNERRLELCFENKRFWDLRRWKMPINEGIKGMKVERIDPENADSPLKYTIINVEDRVFDNSYQCYGPIPYTEVLKYSNLKQNKGWK